MSHKARQERGANSALICHDQVSASVRYNTYFTASAVRKRSPSACLLWKPSNDMPSGLNHSSTSDCSRILIILKWHSRQSMAGTLLKTVYRCGFSTGSKGRFPLLHVQSFSRQGISQSRVLPTIISRGCKSSPLMRQMFPWLPNLLCPLVMVYQNQPAVLIVARPPSAWIGLPNRQ